MIDLCKETYSTALLNGRSSEWDKSFFENRMCARFLSKTVEKELEKNGIVTLACIKECVKNYGFDRTMWVIANSIFLDEWGEGIDGDVLDWCCDIGMENGDENFALELDVGILNDLAKYVRALYAEKDFYTVKDVCADLEYKDKIVVISSEALREESREKNNQLLLAVGGSGCSPSGSDDEILGYFLTDGEPVTFFRSAVFGVMKPELVPEWVKKAQKEIDEIQNPPLRIFLK